MSGRRKRLGKMMRRADRKGRHLRKILGQTLRGDLRELARTMREATARRLTRSPWRKGLGADGDVEGSVYVGAGPAVFWGPGGR